LYYVREYFEGEVVERSHGWCERINRSLAAISTPTRKTLSQLRVE
jgi:hypothetical protein